jgi:hypothetical protein
VSQPHQRSAISAVTLTASFQLIRQAIKGETMRTKQNLRPAISKRSGKALLFTLFFLSSALSSVLHAQTDRQSSAEETKKINEVEKLADRLVERWHETLDMTSIFDEMLVRDPALRVKSVKRLFKIFQFDDSTDEETVIDDDVDDETMKEALLALYNWGFLSEEYQLIFDESTPDPPEAVRVEKEINELPDDRITFDLLRAFVSKANEIASTYRKSLPQSAFKSPRYRARLKAYNVSHSSSLLAQVESGFSELGLEKNVTIYRISRGLFKDLCFVEEDGELRLLMIGCESSDWSK